MKRGWWKTGAGFAGFLAAAGLVAIYALTPRYASGLEPSFAELAYAPVSPTQRLDVFLPEGQGPFPLVINIHGGGFRMGSKEMLDAPIAKSLLARGVAVASVNYRLSDEAKFPAAVQDVKAATRFLRANAAQYRLDPQRFLAFGQSAGGNLASMLGTTGHVTTFDDPALGNANMSARVQGVVDWFGPSDFEKLDAQAKAQGCPSDHHAAESPESAYLGAPVPDVPERARQASPVAAVTADAPPFLLQKGDQDCLIPFAQTQVLYEALTAAGVPVIFDKLSGAGHGDMGATRPIFLSDANVKRVVDFMVETLGHN